MHYNVPATDAPQTWAVATWFILLVVTGKILQAIHFLDFSRALFPYVRSKYKTYNDSTIQQRRSCTGCFTWYHNDCYLLWHVRLVSNDFRAILNKAKP